MKQGKLHFGHWVIKFFTTLYGHEWLGKVPTHVDFGVTNKFYQVGEFAHKESNEEDQLYFGLLTFYFSLFD